MQRFLDTNVVVYYLAQGVNQEFHERAKALIDGPQELWITDVALMEVGHVLLKVLKFPRADVFEALESFVLRENIHVLGHPHEEVVALLRRCKPSTRVTMGDVFIALQVRRAGGMLYTFDGHFPPEIPQQEP